MRKTTLVSALYPLMQVQDAGFYFLSLLFHSGPEGYLPVEVSAVQRPEQEWRECLPSMIECPRPPLSRETALPYLALGTYPMTTSSRDVFPLLVNQK